MSKMIDAEKLKQELSKESVWATLVINDIIDKMAKETDDE